jgi:LmbE family N-acetylglucosaminyl deacetylase
MEVFFFAPHQDDELTNLGIPLCRTLSEGGSAHVVLCTDGGASGVKQMLCNGGGCAWHPGEHNYTLDGPAFTAARDREFYGSCRALGVPEGNILISPLRGPDSGLSAGAALAVMRDAMKNIPPEQRAVVTLAPLPQAGQNPDHTAVGQAANTLFDAGECASLTLVWEFILLPPEPEIAERAHLVPTPDEFEKIKKAAAAYRRWAPAVGRYAVGYHSVADEFDAFLRAPVCVIAKSLCHA